MQAYVIIKDAIFKFLAFINAGANWQGEEYAATIGQLVDDFFAANYSIESIALFFKALRSCKEPFADLEIRAFQPREILRYMRKFTDWQREQYRLQIQETSKPQANDFLTAWAARWEIRLRLLGQWLKASGYAPSADKVEGKRLQWKRMQAAIELARLPQGNIQNHCIGISHLMTSAPAKYNFAGLKERLQAAADKEALKIGAALSSKKEIQAAELADAEASTMTAAKNKLLAWCVAMGGKEGTLEEAQEMAGAFLEEWKPKTSGELIQILKNKGAL